LSYQWRCRAHNGDYLQPYRVATLLAAIGVTVDRRHPGRTRARLERCLETLLADRVIAAWQYDRWDEGHATRQGWVDHWLQATILIEPPEVIQQQYQHLAQHEAATRVALPAPDSLGERLKRRRRQRGLTLIQAAEQLGISPSYLSRLEQGRRGHSLPTAVQRPLDAWLADPPEAAEAPDESGTSLATPQANQVAIFGAAAREAPVGPWSP
jgi:DNA-binding XRE family transcriptional regulator